MNRYFFNTQDGEAVLDVDGVELPDIAHAQIEAVKLMGELLREHAEEFWRTRNFAVTVADEEGATLFTVMTAAARVPMRHLDGRPATGLEGE